MIEQNAGFLCSCGLMSVERLTSSPAMPSCAFDSVEVTDSVNHFMTGCPRGFLDLRCRCVKSELGRLVLFDIFIFKSCDD